MNVLKKIKLQKNRGGRLTAASLCICLVMGSMAVGAAQIGDSSSSLGMVGLTAQESGETTVSTQPGADQSTANVTTAETATQTGESLAEAETETEETGAWLTMLVNRDNPIPEDYEIPELTTLANDFQVDSRIYPALQQMFDDARSQGIYPTITSAYRTMQEQQDQMDQRQSEYMANGQSSEEALAEAQKWVAIPGTSEHQLGLSVDISSTEQDPGAVWYWLNTEAYKYGFIQRYPDAKEEITGISTEPWHYRYVGKAVAKVMYEENLCLEEYLEKYGQTNAEADTEE